MNGRNNLSDDPLWYKDAIFYEVRVGSFYDSVGDGIGDFRGLTAPDSAERAGRILASPDRIESRFDAFLKQKMSIVRICCHGNLHLGQILHTGNGSVVIYND